MYFKLILILFFKLFSLNILIAQCSIFVEDISVCESEQIIVIPDFSSEVSDLVNKYNVQQIDFEPIDISKSNDLEMGDDQVFGPYEIGFDFTFFNEVFSQFWISSNGFISFVESPTTYNSSPLPNAGGPYSAIFGSWEDWNPGGGGDIFFASFPGKLVVQFIDLNSYNCGNDPDTTGTFQIVLHKNTNYIDIHVKQKIECTNSVQGIQNFNGTYAAFVEGRNSSLWSAQNQSFRFSPLSTQYLNWYDSNNTLIYSGCPLIIVPEYSQSYSVEFNDGDQCQSSDDFFVDVSLPFPTISVNGSLLLCDISGYQYQWLLDGIEIEGANAQYYSPNSNGIYTVSVTNQFNCNKISNPFVVDFSSIISIDEISYLNVFPQPSNRKVTLNVNIDGVIHLHDIKSRLLKSFDVNKGQNLELNLEKGIYIAKLVDSSRTYAYQKIIIQ